METLTEDQKSAFIAIVANPYSGGAIQIDGGAGAGKSFVIDQGNLFDVPAIATLLI